MFLSFLIIHVLQGSKDNMSVVLVCFPGAPTVSEDAQQKDRELNSLIEKRVQGMSARESPVGASY